MRQQIVFRQYNPNKPHRYGLLMKSLNDAGFPDTYKAGSYTAKPKAADDPYYLKSTIDYMRYLVAEMKADQPITDQSSLTSIESTNWLLDHGFVTVAERGKRNTI